MILIVTLKIVLFMTFNLKKEKKEEVNIMNDLLSKSIPTESSKMVPYNGKKESMTVYKIPLNYLKYNVNNGRIASHANEINGTKIDDKIMNDIVENKIIESNKKAILETKENIRIWGQNEPGIVMSNGVVIDGNRRFTCLRLLNKENLENDKFKYFNAVILKDEMYDEKALKELEWFYQMGLESRLDYDPIDKLVDIYNQIIDKKYFTIEEYSKITNTKISEAKEKYNEAILMNELLIYVNEEKNWHIAKKLKLEGSLSESIKILNSQKIKNDYKSSIKEMLFNYMLVAPNKNISKYVREIGETIRTSDDKSIESFFESNTMANQEIKKIIKNKITENDILNLRNDENLIVDLESNYDKFKINAHRDKMKNAPKELLEKTFFQINRSIDVEIINCYNIKEKMEIKSLIEKFINLFNNLKDNINE